MRIIFDGNVYRQAIGIPMGTNAGPHVANIYLHQYEIKNKYSQTSISINIIRGTWAYYKYILVSKTADNRGANHRGLTVFQLFVN